MDRKRKEYVRSFIGRCGYRILDVSEQEEDWIFGYLARLDEYETDEKYHGLNWEWIFANDDARQNMRTPIIDKTLSRWCDEGKLAINLEQSARWPKDKSFALCLTHDVDMLQRFLWRERWRSLTMSHGVGPVERLKRLLGFLRHGGRALASIGGGPLDLKIWMEAEAENEFHSTFFFVPDLDVIVEPEPQDCYYRYRDLVFFEGRKIPIRDLIRSVSDSGWDVGLHGSMGSSCSSARLCCEKENVAAASGRAVVSNRQHYLRFDVRDTPRYLEEAGFQSDSTLGSNLECGFRAGTGGPFFWYDPARETTLDLIEVPLIIQDNSLIKSCGGDEDKVVDEAGKIIRRAAKYGTAVTLLWHNNYDVNSVQYRSYVRILRQARALGAWGCSVRELSEWWRARPSDAGGVDRGMEAG